MMMNGFTFLSSFYLVRLDGSVLVATLEYCKCQMKIEMVDLMFKEPAKRQNRYDPILHENKVFQVAEK
jgi:hypothetical protein